MRPINVVVSVGPNNYGHPTQTALNLYRSVGATTHRTDLNGTVTVTVRPGGAYAITTERGKGTQGAAPVTPPPRSTATPGVSPTRPAAPTTVIYRNCAEARAAGAAPLLRGQLGYSTSLDRDGDGKACE